MAQENQVMTLGTLVALIAVALLGILFMPVLQAIGYGLLIQSPSTLYWIALCIIGAGALFYTEHPTAALCFGGAALFMAFMIGPFMSGVYAQEHILANQDFEQRAELNDTGTNHTRVLSQNVANRYAESANQLPKYQTGESDIAYQNGSYTWSYPVTPDRFFVSWQGNQWGAYYVDMEQTSRSVETSQTTIRNGRGQLFVDSFGYQTTWDRMDVSHRDDTSFVFEDDGETHVARSYVTHDWHWRWAPIPMPYAVPEYGGTQVMNPDGTIEDYSPQEVADSELLESQNTYPYQLARFRMNSMQLRNGLLNRMFIGEGVPQIADTSGFSDNQQPFTVPTDGSDGTPSLDYFIAATPTGSGDGIYQIYRIDGQTGDISYVEFNDTRAGPAKAAGYTRSQNREPNWAANNEGGSTQITEPIPVILDADLYWHMRVTPTDGSRISYTTFVSADSGNVYRADTTAEIVSFIESGGTTTTDVSNDTQPSDGQQSGSGGDATITVHVVEDGEVVDTFTVEDDQSIQISADDSGNQTEAAG